jgi:methyl-accepting chemotaxis protein
MKKKENQRVTFIHSIKSKMILMVFCALVVAIGMALWTTIPLIRKTMKSLSQSSMIDIAVVAGEDLEREVDTLGAESVLTAETLEEAVGDIQINGMSSSYAYVVAADGTMLYHPTAEKIGQPVENAVVTSLVGEISQGKRPETEAIEYEFKGATKYASYYIDQQSRFILVITEDESDVTSGMYDVIRRCVISSIMTVLLCTFFTLYLAIRLVRPIGRSSAVVAKLSDLDFTEHEYQAALSRRKDESGVMGRSIEHLREELSVVVRKITGQSGELYEASNTLSTNAKETAAGVEQVEKAISEIAEGATSQAQETQTATENVIVMGNMIEETNEEVEKLRGTMQEMRVAGDNAMDILNELSAVNQRTKDAMQIIFEQTNVTNDSAMKIKAATDIITDIAEETNLLSLNASIEAARAGEQGRGFAVVAGQIQKLAEQSNESARKIEDIINVLIEESQKSVKTMEDVREVIVKQNENVKNTQQAFSDVKNGIDSSIDGIGNIADKTEKLDAARVKVVDVVQSLTAIAEENAASTEETSASAAEVGAIMGDIAENANRLNEIAKELEESVKQFVVE